MQSFADALAPTSGGLDPAIAPATQQDSATPRPRVDTQSANVCYHCGEWCGSHGLRKLDKLFCCHGCQTVYELLVENGLTQFYELDARPGVRVAQTPAVLKWRYLDDPVISRKLLDFSDQDVSRVTLRVPAIHCLGCVWLLENLYRLHPGIGRSRVNFLRKEVSITFTHGRIPLSELARLLASLGYEPELTLADTERHATDPSAKRRYLQIGVAGFAFGNIMLLSFPSYFGIEAGSERELKGMLAWAALALAVPVLVYSAADYFRSALVALKQRVVTIEVPIAVGLVALFGQSAFEILSDRGAGYLDSLAGLVFFLLCGKLFQSKTFDRLAFDRDFRCFFPLSVMRVADGVEEVVPLAVLRIGDRLRVRHGELIPADARLVHGAALLDYSFVTGESEPVARKENDHLYAGGQQVGGMIEIEVVKAVSQSYLTSVWSQEAFQKPTPNGLETVTNRFSRRFTWIVITVAFGSALFWSLSDPAKGLRSFTAVLIVACPCALALAAPFALGSAQRWLARRGVFLKDTHVIERLAKVNTVVLDKTGTLTIPGAQGVSFQGERLSAQEARLVHALARVSTHPLSRRIRETLECFGEPLEIGSFIELPGSGIRGEVEGHWICLGSPAWLRELNIDSPEVSAREGTSVCLAIDGRLRGQFVLEGSLRPEIAQLAQELNAGYEVALLSGDNERERDRFRELFGERVSLHFNQGPGDKLEFIRSLQQQSRTVMMVRDGLNDAGALRQSDVGVAVVEQVGIFSPASDVILDAGMVKRLGAILKFSRAAVRIVRASFLISSLYNVLGISIAARGLLSPIICAILMPLSSVSVVVFACCATTWRARGFGALSTANVDDRKTASSATISAQAAAPTGGSVSGADGGSNTHHHLSPQMEAEHAASAI